MFDDVIDHSYDTIIDPLPRLIQALSSNISLLQDSELAKNAWRTCQHRMKNNVELAKQLELAIPDRITSVLIELNNNINQPNWLFNKKPLAGLFFFTLGL